MKDETSKLETGASGADTSPKSIVLSKIESYYYWHVLVKKAFVMVTNGEPRRSSADSPSKDQPLPKRPTEAYFFPDLDEDGFFPNIIFPFKQFPRPNRYGKMASSPRMHALKITLHDDLDKPSLPAAKRLTVKVVILPAGAIDGWQDGIVFGAMDDTWLFPMHWQTPLWEKCGLTIPPSYKMKRDLKLAAQDSTSVSPDIKSLIGLDSRRLLLAMMNRYWEARNEKDVARASQVENAGIEGKQSGTTILQQSAKTGLRRANSTQMKSAALRLKKEAKNFMGKHPEVELDAECADIKIVKFRIPDETDTIVGHGNAGSMTDHLVARLGHLHKMELLTELESRVTNPAGKSILSKLRKEQRRRQGKLSRKSQSRRVNPKVPKIDDLS